MRIAVIAPPWYEVPPTAYGGIESICDLLVRGLVSRGHDVTLVAAGNRRLDAAFVQSYERPPSTRVGEALPELIHAGVAAAALEDRGVDVVHDHSLAGPLVASGAGIPWVVTAHGPVHGEFLRYYRSIAKSVSLVAISNAQRHAAPGLPWAGTVYNAIDVDQYPFVPDKDDHAVFLGRMHPSKGAHLAIDAARAAGVRLILAAKCQEPLERRYFEEKVAPRLGPDAVWVGEVGPVEKKRLLGSAGCLLFPIQWEEPFGMVMIEAMACGTPVVALGRGSVPEIVEDGVSGFVCGNTDDLPEAIRASRSIDPYSCRKLVVDRFSAEGMVDGYERLYDALRSGELAAGKTRSPRERDGMVAVGR